MKRIMTLLIPRKDSFARGKGLLPGILVVLRQYCCAHEYSGLGGLPNERGPSAGIEKLCVPPHTRQ